MTGQDLIDIFNSKYEFMGGDSAPGFTDSEILVLLNESRDQFISKRAFGNNIYKAGFEGSVKRIDDLEKLVTSSNLTTITTGIVANLKFATLPDDYLHFVDCSIVLDTDKYLSSELIMHSNIKRLLKTNTNNPWIKNSFVFIRDGKAGIIFDSTDYTDLTSVNLTYLKEPQEFIISDIITEFKNNILGEIVNMAIYNAIHETTPSAAQGNVDKLKNIE